jgi:hypothetical protein
VHLLTREALALYLTKLADGGRVVFHISNRHLQLEPMLARLASDAGLVAFLGFGAPTSEEEANQIFPSQWVAMAESAESLGAIASRGGWPIAREQRGIDLWTDDFSNILSVLRW